MEKEFKVGDTVVIKGTVVRTDYAGEYKIGINIKNDNFIRYYLPDGKASHLDSEPTIFKETTQEQERVVQVRNCLTDEWVNRVLIREKKGKFLCWGFAETIEEAKSTNTVSIWNFMREVPEPKIITMQEIADKFNIDIKQIIIS
jgi:hypothetical protein